MSRDEVMEQLEQLGWEPAANVEFTLLEKKSILHELEEKVTKSEMNDNPNVCAGLSRKSKIELRSVQGTQHSSVGTRDETTADKEDQRGTSRTRTTTTDNPGLRTTPR